MEIKETQQNKWIFYLIIFGLVMVIISMYTCKGNAEKSLVKVPETSGKMPISKPEQKPILII